MVTKKVTRGVGSGARSGAYKSQELHFCFKLIFSCCFDNQIICKSNKNKCSDVVSFLKMIYTGWGGGGGGGWGAGGGGGEGVRVGLVETL